MEPVNEYMEGIPMEDLVGIAIAFAALLLSAISAWLTSKRNSRTEKMSREALETANRANDIASEALLQIPVVSLKRMGDSPAFEKDWVENGLQVEVVNHSETPVSGIVFKINPLSGYIYRFDAPHDLVELPFASRKLSFYEALLKSAAAQIEISPYLFAYIKENLDQFSEPDIAYNATFNIVAAPIQEGRDVAVSWRPNGSGDRQIVSLQFVPSLIDSLPVERLIDAAEKKLKIFSGY